MSTPLRRRFRRKGQRVGASGDRNAFSLMELLIVVAIIGMINGLTIAFSGHEWQRERINSVALGLAGWLEEVRVNALRKTSDTATVGGCQVTVSTLTDAVAGTSVASVSPTDCASSPTFVIPGVSGNVDRYTIVNSNADTITFTPRGSVTATSDATINIQLVGTRQLRCVRVSSILGLIRIGNSTSAGSAADLCNDYSHF
ncbi:MAG: Tfp pilus assembly protein FimT/FimU [Cyanobium sp.]